MVLLLSAQVQQSILSSLRKRKNYKEGTDYFLFNGDGIDMLSDLPVGSIDLIVIDPPYQMNLGVWDTKWTPLQWETLLSHVWRILRPG